MAHEKNSKKTTTVRGLYYLYFDSCVVRKRVECKQHAAVLVLVGLYCRTQRRREVQNAQRAAESPIVPHRLEAYGEAVKGRWSRGGGHMQATACNGIGGGRVWRRREPNGSGRPAPPGCSTAPVSTRSGRALRFCAETYAVRVTHTAVVLRLFSQVSPVRR